MLKPLLAVLACTAVLVPAPAHAAPPDPGPGLLCGFAATDLGGGQHSGTLYGGPIAYTDTAGNPKTGTLLCTIQVNVSTHSGFGAAFASGTGTGTIVVVPAPVTFSAGPDDNVYYCSALWLSTQGTLYWSDSNDPLVDGNWSTDPNANCGLSVTVGPMRYGPQPRVG